MLELLKANGKIYRTMRLVVGLLRLFDVNFYNIYKVNKRCKNPSITVSKILLAGSVGSNPDTLMQTLVGLGFKASGRQVYQLSCDAVMPICYNAKQFHYKTITDQLYLAKKGMGSACITCRLKSRVYSSAAGFKQLNFSQYPVSKKKVKEVLDSIDFTEALLSPSYRKEFTYNDVSVLNHAYSALVRFYASNQLIEEVASVELFKAYCRASIITVHIIAGVLEDLGSIDAVVCDHGIYVPQGVITEFCKLNGIRIITFNTGYRKNSFLFAEGDSYHFAIPRDIHFKNKKFSDFQRAVALEYIQSRKSGSNDWVYFQEKNQQGSISFNPEIRKIALFPNVLWDADIHFNESLFDSSTDWLNETIQFALDNSDFEIHIRVHPGELKGFIKSRISVLSVISPDYLNHNRVKIYEADHPVNSYFLAENCDLSVVQGSKIGIDLASLGKKVLVAGDCWTRDKNITCDPNNKKDYFECLLNIDRIKIDQSRALDFAYYLYFEKSKVLNSISKRKGDPPFYFNAKVFLDNKDELNAMNSIITGENYEKA